MSDVARPFVPPVPSRSSVLLAALVRRTLRPVLRGIRPGARDDWIWRAVTAIDRLSSALRIPLGTPLRGTSVRPIDLGTCTAEWVAAPGAAASRRMILYFHGGGFVIGGPQTHRRLVSRLSAVCGTPVLSVQYRQLPRVSVRDSIADGVTAFRYLLRTYQPSEIVLAGDSAGGHLAVAVAAAVRTLALPQPAGIVVISPWIDLAGADGRQHPNVRLDPYITPNVLAWISHLHRTRFGPFCTDVSGDGDLHGLAPTLIQVGGLEILAADAEALEARLVGQGVACQLQIYPGQMHVFQLLADMLPEGRRALREVAVFVSALGRGTATA